MLWLGSQLTNGQFYQATIIVEFASYCDQMRFYKSENHQIVYVSLKDELPFSYKPEPVVAITPEIDRICRAKNSLETISFRDR